MKRMLLRGAPIAASVLVTLGASAAHATQAHKNLSVSRMYYQYVYVPAGTTYTWETTNLSAGADTVLHLWDAPAQSEVGYDDNSGPGLASKVSYTNGSGSMKSLMLIARAYSASTNGTARLVQNGATLVSSFPVGGTRVIVEDGPGYKHETAGAPGSTANPWLVALDCSRHMVDVDFSSGVDSQARVSHPDTCWVMVGTTSGSGKVHLYSNDPEDNDGDGLGQGLELDLPTCDLPSWSYCTGVHNLADTDRDGIPDGAEVFGIDDPDSPQLLSAWGADPLHKDVFVEVDYEDVFGATNPFTEADAVAAADLFATGKAADLGNPDGTDGVHLHLDIGKNPSVSTLAGLFGDWGGSNFVEDGTSYTSAPSKHRHPARSGVFHYALMTDQGTGQSVSSPGDRLYWAASEDSRAVQTFAHELGHNLGLRHWGHDSWGKANGKPNYLSLINYAYSGASFSQGENEIVLNPAGTYEQDGIGADATHIGEDPYYREILPSGEVDWDFDGQFGAARERAPVTYATWKSDGALTQNEQDLVTSADLSATTPALIRGPNGRMYAFYILGERILYQHGAMNGFTSQGSCPGGDSIDDLCTAWSAPVMVPSFLDARGVTALYAGGQVLLAFRTTLDSLRTIRATGTNGAGELTGWTAETYRSATTDREPEVELVRVDPGQFGGATSAIALFYRDKATGRYRWSTMSSVTSSTTVSRGDLLDQTGAAISGAQSPTFTSWPYDPQSTPNGTLCGALTNDESKVGFYCYDRASNRFEEMPAFAERKFTSAKPGLAYHAYRSWTGAPRNGDPTRGAFWLTVAKDAAEHDYVNVWISDPVSQEPEEELALVSFPNERGGKVGNEWTNMVDGAGLALYDDASLGAMKGLWLRQNGKDGEGGAVKVRFLPLADGTFRVHLKDGNDFQVMERGICVGIAGGAYCGSSSFGLD